MEGTYFVYREPESVQELKSLFLLRYSVYRESRLKHLTPENESGMNIDSHDMYSRHFGFYHHSDGKSRPVGYIRMVKDQPGPWATDIAKMAAGFPSIGGGVLPKPLQPFPLMDYVPDAGPVNTLYDQFKSEGENLVEPGRLSLDRSVRSLGISGQLRVSTQLVASTFAAFIVDGVAKAILTASVTHKSFYRQFGFCQAPGVSDWFWIPVGENRTCLLGSADDLPSAMNQRVLRMAEAYHNTGRICYYPEKSEQFFPPVRSYVVSRPALLAA